MRAQERLTSKNRRKGRATNTTLQTNSQKANNMQTKSQNQPNTGTPYCYLAKYGDRRLVIFYLFFFFIFNYQLQQAPRKLNGNSVKSGIYKYMQIHWHLFSPSQRER